jgi:hypothetical protein
MSKSALKLVHAISLIGGTALFIYLIVQTGPSTLLRYLKQTGWGFALIVILSGLRNVLRGGSWYFAIAPEHRSISFWRLINVMLAGEAIKYLTATGPFVGEPAKAGLVRHQVPLMQGFSSVLVENLIYYSTVFVFMLCGLPALAWLVKVPGGYRIAGYVILTGILAAIVLIWLSVGRKWYPLARLFEMISRRKPDHHKMKSFAARLREVETEVYRFYALRRLAFAGIFAINMGAHLINVVEVCLILALFNLPVMLLAGLVMEAVTKIVNLVFFFVPTRAGVYESAHTLVISELGMPASAGLALGIVRKLRAFVWIAYGLVAIGIFTLRREEG